MRPRHLLPGACGHDEPRRYAPTVPGLGLPLQFEFDRGRDVTGSYGIIRRAQEQALTPQPLAPTPSP